MCIRDRVSTRPIAVTAIDKGPRVVSPPTRLTPVSYTHLDVYKRQPVQAAAWLFVCAISHALLDAMTSGGLGVALLLSLIHI